MRADNILASEKFGTTNVIFRQSKDLTRIGHPYFEVVLSSKIKDRVFRIWAGELVWFATTLNRITEMLTWPEVTKSIYPIGFNPYSSGALGLSLVVGDRERSFQLTRYETKFTKKDDNQSFHTRYYFYKRFNQLGIPWDEEALIRFNQKISIYLIGMAGRLADKINGGNTSFNDLSVAEIFSRIALSTQCAGIQRRMMALPGQSLEGANVTVLPEDAQIRVLKETGIPITHEEIAARIENILDARSVRELLDWTRRYAAEVLGKAWVVTSQDTTHVTAAHSPESFAKDPLLTSLQSSPVVKGTSSGKFASVTQCSTRALETVLSRGDCSGLMNTRFGDIPFPTEVSRSPIVRLFIPARGLRMHRWRVLQLLEMYSCSLCNLPAKDDGETILDLQRLTVLENDVRILFNDECELVESVLENALIRRTSILEGRRELFSYKNLPKRGD